MDAKEVINYIIEKYSEIEWGFVGRSFVPGENRGYYLQGEKNKFIEKYRGSKKYFLINRFSDRAVENDPRLSNYIVVTKFKEEPSSINIEITKKGLNNENNFCIFMDQLEKNASNFTLECDFFDAFIFNVSNIQALDENVENLRENNDQLNHSLKNLGDEILDKLDIRFNSFEELRKDIIFELDDWDDFGFQNTIQLSFQNWDTDFYIHVNPHDKKKIEEVLNNRIESNFDRFLARYNDFKQNTHSGVEQEINDIFCSLGEEDYYSFFNKYVKYDVRKKWFEVICDLAYNINIFDNFVDFFDKYSQNDVTTSYPVTNNFFKSSFLRDTTPLEVRLIFHQLTMDESFEVNSLSSKEIKYDFSSDKDYQIEGELLLSRETRNGSSKKVFDILGSNNVFAIIGSNGSGKTQLIRKIIKSHISRDNNFIEIVHFSLSPFDKPLDKDEEESDTYERIGVEKAKNSNFDLLKQKVVLDGNLEENDRLKINRDLEGLDNTILDNYFSNYLLEMVLDLFNPKNEQELKLWKDSLEYFTFEKWAEDILREFESGNLSYNNFVTISNLSSGQKTILLYITKLVFKVSKGSLIIFDEPETFMHPPMMKAFVRSIQKIVTENKAKCLIATHSPVMIQEIPHDFVYRLIKIGDNKSRIERMRYRTYGENLDSIYQNIYGVEFRRTGFFEKLGDFYDEVGDVEKSITIEDFQKMDTSYFGDEALLRFHILLDELERGDEDISES